MVASYMRVSCFYWDTHFVQTLPLPLITLPLIAADLYKYMSVYVCVRLALALTSLPAIFALTTCEGWIEARQRPSIFMKENTCGKAPRRGKEGSMWWGSSQLGEKGPDGAEGARARLRPLRESTWSRCQSYRAGTIIIPLLLVWKPRPPNVK